MARFFIHRPVFAWVLAIATMLLGAFSMTGLPISQNPDIAPTTVRISATYTGASAATVENSVTTVIEDGLTGLDELGRTSPFCLDSASSSAKGLFTLYLSTWRNCNVITGSTQD